MMPKDYVPIDKKRRLNAAIKAQRVQQGEDLRPGDTWAKKALSTVVCKCGASFQSKVHASFTRFKVITQKPCPVCKSRTGSVRTTAI